MFEHEVVAVERIAGDAGQAPEQLRRDQADLFEAFECDDLVGAIAHDFDHPSVLAPALFRWCRRRGQTHAGIVEREPHAAGLLAAGAKPVRCNRAQRQHRHRLDRATFNLAGCLRLRQRREQRRVLPAFHQQRHLFRQQGGCAQHHLGEACLAIDPTEFARDRIAVPESVDAQQPCFRRGRIDTQREFLGAVLTRVPADAQRALGPELQLPRCGLLEETRQLAQQRFQQRLVRGTVQFEPFVRTCICRRTHTQRGDQTKFVGAEATPRHWIERRGLQRVRRYEAAALARL